MYRKSAPSKTANWAVVTFHIIFYGFKSKYFSKQLWGSLILKVLSVSCFIQNTGFISIKQEKIHSLCLSDPILRYANVEIRSTFYFSTDSLICIILASPAKTFFPTPFIFLHCTFVTAGTFVFNNFTFHNKKNSTLVIKLRWKPLGWSTLLWKWYVAILLKFIFRVRQHISKNSYNNLKLNIQLLRIIFL